MTWGSGSSLQGGAKVEGLRVRGVPEANRVGGVESGSRQLWGWISRTGDSVGMESGVEGRLISGVDSVGLWSESWDPGGVVRAVASSRSSNDRSNVMSPKDMDDVPEE